MIAGGCGVRIGILLSHQNLEFRHKLFARQIMHPLTQLSSGYIKDVRGIQTIAENAGHSWITSFPLPASAWWNDYYTPLLARLPGLEEKYRIQPEAQAIIAVTKQEISLYHQYPDEYGYQFILLKNGE